MSILDVILPMPPRRNSDDMGMPPVHVHEWSDWKEVGRTGDWFHPLIVERKCKTCGATETDEH